MILSIVFDLIEAHVTKHPRSTLTPKTNQNDPAETREVFSRAGIPPILGRTKPLSRAVATYCTAQLRCSCRLVDHLWICGLDQWISE